jgi:YD repeat-containing protein
MGNQDLLSVTRPNEVVNGGPASLVYEYGNGYSDKHGNAFDKVTGIKIGGMNASGVDAGGSYSYTYQQLALGAITGDPNQPISLLSETDRNGNISKTVFNPLGYVTVEQEHTRGLREGEPIFFETRYAYNADGRLIRTIDPEGNFSEITIDDDNPSRFAQGNSLVFDQYPGPRSGDQDRIRSLYLYEPIYQQIHLSIDPRGLDDTFTPPIPDPSGRSQWERYSVRNFFDYQEGDPGTVLPQLADQLGATEAEVEMLLEDAGVQLGLGDINLDGIISTSIAGNVIATFGPDVVLLEDSNQANIEGDQLQEIFALYRYNEFGQLVSQVDAEGNVHRFDYFSEDNPSGGAATPLPMDGRTLDPFTGGYLEQEVRDAEHLIINGHAPNNGSGATTSEIIRSFAYDPVGNTTAVIDGRGIRTEFVVNELNQVVQTIRAAAVPSSGPSVADEPLQLEAFSYVETVEYDANNNVVRRSIEDRGNTSNTDGFVDFTYTYDILDNLVTETQEVDVDTILTTQYRYDANENLTFTLYRKVMPPPLSMTRGTSCL